MVAETLVINTGQTSRTHTTESTYGYNNGYQGRIWSQRTQSTYAPAPTLFMKDHHNASYTLNGFYPDQAFANIQQLSMESLDKTRMLNLRIEHPMDDLMSQLLDADIDWQYVSQLSIDMSLLSSKGVNCLQRIIAKIPAERFDGRDRFTFRLLQANADSQVNEQVRQHIRLKENVAQSKKSIIKNIVLGAALLIGALVVGAAIETLVGFVISVVLAGYAIKFAVDTISSINEKKTLTNELTELERDLNDAEFVSYQPLQALHQAPEALEPSAPQALEAPVQEESTRMESSYMDLTGDLIDLNFEQPKPLPAYNPDFEVTSDSSYDSDNNQMTP